MELSAVVVSWNVRSHLRRCLASLWAQEGVEMEVVVVDNASADSSPAMVRDEFPRTRLVVNSVNRGYAAATNQGMGLSRGRYLLLINPDTEVLADAPIQMMDYLEADPGVGLVGPQLLNPDGTVQSSRRRFPSLLTAFVESTILQRYLDGLLHLRRYYCRDTPDDQVQEVDWMVGACLMARRKVVEAVGGLDETFFMYFEEVDWYLRTRRVGWGAVYLPTAQVIHHYGQSSDQNLARRHLYFQRSKWLFYRKHYGPGVGNLVRAFLLATYLYQMGEEGAKLALRHKPALRRERLGLMWQVVRGGLG